MEGAQEPFSVVNVPLVGVMIFTESLILAQDERLRRA